jgi:hypothetical protein
MNKVISEAVLISGRAALMDGKATGTLARPPASICSERRATAATRSPGESGQFLCA